jgi:hypothetical protein
MRPLPHAAHRKFVETEGWDRKGKARRPGATGDHFRYTLTLANGDVLSTRVSHGSGQLDNQKVVAHVLRDQLAVSEDDFWRCVKDGVLPPRPRPPQVDAGRPPLDAKLVRNLLRKVHLSQDEVAAMTPAEAVSAWDRWLTAQHASEDL